jgi:hypothetical protein
MLIPDKEAIPAGPLDSRARGDTVRLLGAYVLGMFPNAKLVRYSCVNCLESLWKLIDLTQAPGDRCTCWEQQASTLKQELSDLESRSPKAITVILFDGIPTDYSRPADLPNIHLDAAFSPMTLYTLLATRCEETLDPWIILDPNKRATPGEVALAQILAPHLNLIDGNDLSFFGSLMDQVLPVWDKRKRIAARDHLGLMIFTREERHAISNLIGPVLLGFSPQQERLKRIIAKLNLVISCTTNGRSSVFAQKLQWNSWRHLTDNGPIELVLIDDQFRNGWGQVLCNAIGAEFIGSNDKGLAKIGQSPDKSIIVSSCDSPEFLLERLRQIGDDEHDRRFRLRVGTEQRKNEILFLDLRLFEGRPLRQEARFLAEVLEIARSRFLEHHSLPPDRDSNGEAEFKSELHLGWPGFDEAKLARLSDWLNDAQRGAVVSRSDERYLEALTLLPRVVALTDLSLPIVIFSSTGQRMISEELKRYGNIITSFEKPRLFGYQTEDILLRTRDGFSRAMEKALAICNARSLCAHVLHYAEQWKTATRKPWKGVSRFEVYIDESGKSAMEGDRDRSEKELRRFVIAGLLVGYEESPDADPQALHDRMAQNGLRWWPENETAPYLLKDYCSNKNVALKGARIQPRPKTLEEFLHCLPPNKAVGFCIEYPANTKRSNFDLRDEQELDNRYRLMLSDLLEMIIFDLLTQFTTKRVPTLSIFVATRVRSFEEYVDGEESIKELSEHWGYRVTLNHERAFSIEESAIAPIVYQLTQFCRRSDGAEVQIRHARGVELFYPSQGRNPNALERSGQPVTRTRPRWDKTRHQHYVADLLAGECRSVSSNIVNKYPWSELFKEGLYDIYDDNLECLLNAARAVSFEQLTSALLALKKFRWEKKLLANSGALLILKLLVDRIQSDLVGTDFIALANELETPLFQSQSFVQSVL